MDKLYNILVDNIGYYDKFSYIFCTDNIVSPWYVNASNYNIHNNHYCFISSEGYIRSKVDLFVIYRSYSSV